MKDNEIHIFDYPDTFLVDTDEPDRDIIEIFDDRTPYPHFVDITEPFCSCRDFRFNLVNEKERATCKHIDACRKYIKQFTSKPKKLPTTIAWTFSNSSEIDSTPKPESPNDAPT